MLAIRKGQDRGFFDHSWLKTYHTFSFGEYMDPTQMGFGPLRVINEDFIEAAAGFPTHGHRDMEIITYVVKGEVQHRDSTGGEGAIKPGEVQCMTAGSGIRHSEFNGRKDIETHLYQIWILPDKSGHTPLYRQKDFTPALSTGKAVLLVSGDGKEDSIQIHQDAKLWARRFTSQQDWSLPLKANRKGWLQVVKGEVSLSGQTLNAGDGAGMIEETDPLLQAKPGSEVLFFDLKP